MRSATHRLAVSMAFVAALGAQTTGQSARTLSLETIYDPASRADFNGVSSPDVAWVDGRTYLVPRAGGRGVEWLRVDAATGRSSALFDADRMESAIGALPGVTREEARLLARSQDITFNPTKTAVVIELS